MGVDGALDFLVDIVVLSVGVDVMERFSEVVADFHGGSNIEREVKLMGSFCSFRGMEPMKLVLLSNSRAKR